MSETNEAERLNEVYALIWRSTDPEGVFNQEEFESRIPRLMVWLRKLRDGGHLVGCGGGAFENYGGGLTLITASSPEEARNLSAGSPMNEIGSTDIMIWDVFFADLSIPRAF